MGQWREIGKQLVAGNAMFVGPRPFKIDHQPMVHSRRGDAAIVQQTSIIKQLLLCLGPAHEDSQFPSQHADPATVQNIVHTHQVNRVGDGDDQLPQVNGQVSGLGWINHDSAYQMRQGQVLP